MKITIPIFRHSVFLYGLIVLLTFIPFSLSAQNRCFSFGIRYGINYSKISNQPDIAGIPLEDFTNFNLTSNEAWLNTKIDFRTTYSLGGYLEYHFNNEYSVIFEIKYSNKGAIFNGQFFSPIILNGFTLNSLIKINTTIKLSYYSFPVLLKYVLPVRHKLHPYIILGPELSYIAKAETGKINWKHITWNPDNPKNKNMFETPSENLERYTEEIEYVITIGGGFIYYSMGRDIILDGRYCIGVSNINKIARKDILSNMISLSIGISIFNYE